jgi:hypothetical protein
MWDGDEWDGVMDGQIDLLGYGEPLKVLMKSRSLRCRDVYWSDVLFVIVVSFFEVHSALAPTVLSARSFCTELEPGCYRPSRDYCSGSLFITVHHLSCMMSWKLLWGFIFCSIF